MMMWRRGFFLLCAMVCSGVSSATTLMQWVRLPLAVPLHTGHERVILVNRNVRVGYPAALDGKLRIQSSGGTVYLLPREDFPTTRLQLVDMDSGALILLDVQATAGETLEPVELRYDDAVYRNDSVSSGDGKREENAGALKVASAVLPVAPLPVLLTRYAAQSLYGPLRTVEALPGIAPAPLRLPPVVTTLLPAEPVTASPLAAWQRDALTVTAVRLQNRSERRIDLDPRALQGDFVTVTFQHAWLGAQGTPEDTTLVYLVTRGGADRAVLPEPVVSNPQSENGGH